MWQRSMSRIRDAWIMNLTGRQFQKPQKGTVILAFSCSSVKFVFIVQLSRDSFDSLNHGWVDKGGKKAESCSFSTDDELA